jgi:phosphoglycerate dehydrogenase-like enzyme
LKWRFTVPESKKVRVGVNGYGVIGKRVAAAVAQQKDMVLAGPLTPSSTS